MPRSNLRPAPGCRTLREALAPLAESDSRISIQGRRPSDYPSRIPRARVSARVPDSLLERREVQSHQARPADKAPHSRSGEFHSNRAQAPLEVVYLLLARATEVRVAVAGVRSKIGFGLRFGRHIDPRQRCQDPLQIPTSLAQRRAR